MTSARSRVPALAVTIGAAAVLAPVLSLGAPAQAAAGGNGGAPSVINSPNFAGYQAPVTPGSATSSAARFTVPALSCTSAYRAITPVAGVEVNASKSYSSAFLFTGCRKGKAQYFPALVINGEEVNYTATAARPGDVIKIAAKVTTKGTTVTITDATTGVTKKRTGPGAPPDAAYAGDSDWAVNGTPLGVPRFGSLTFTSCSVDGRALARSHPSRYQRVNSRKTLQISTGGLTSGGTAFPTRYQHS